MESMTAVSTAHHAALPIEFLDASYYAGGVSMLSETTVTIPSGEPTVVIGPNGSGKTTFLRLGMGLLTATSGRVHWAGKRLSPDIRMSFVFQHPTMLRRTVTDNIRYALRAACVPRNLHRRRTEELLELVGLVGLGERPARRLSGGERQRLALARALSRSPQVLFLDEPTASLDPAATKSVEDLLRTVAQQGIKIVIATHDLGEARRLAGDVIMLNRGRIVEHGRAPAFFASPHSREATAFLAGELLL